MGWLSAAPEEHWRVPPPMQPRQSWGHARPSCSSNSIARAQLWPAAPGGGLLPSEEKDGGGTYSHLSWPGLLGGGLTWPGEKQRVGIVIRLTHVRRSFFSPPVAQGWQEGGRRENVGQEPEGHSTSHPGAEMSYRGMSRAVPSGSSLEWPFSHWAGPAEVGSGAEGEGRSKPPRTTAVGDSVGFRLDRRGAWGLAAGAALGRWRGGGMGGGWARSLAEKTSNRLDLGLLLDFGFQTGPTRQLPRPPPPATRTPAGGWAAPFFSSNMTSGLQSVKQNFLRANTSKKNCCSCRCISGQGVSRDTLSSWPVSFWGMLLCR